jgi:putative colanic acid biosynthesis acetyltransferase WcaF
MTLEAAAPFDIETNRAARKYSRREQLMRVAWAAGRWLIRLSPRPFFGWRRFVLRQFGARLGQEVRIYSTTHLYMPWNVEIDDWAAIGEDVFIYSLGKVRIGKRVAVSYRAHVCAGTHDFADATLPLLKPPVTIEDDAFVGTEAFIGPDVTVGRAALVGARCVVMKDVPPLAVVAGNPCKIIGTRKLPATDCN